MVKQDGDNHNHRNMNHCVKKCQQLNIQTIGLKRIKRNFRQYIIRYTALGFLIFLGMYMVISLVGAADTIICGVNRKAGQCLLESGEFSLMAEMTEEEKENFATLVSLEEKFSTDYRLSDQSVLRIFCVRKKMNLAVVEKGRLPVSDTEVLIEKRYMQEHHYQVGDNLIIADRTFTICGIGTSPDYDAPYRNLTDSTIDSSGFGTAFVTSEAYAWLDSQDRGISAEELVYAYRLKKNVTDQMVRDKLKSLYPATSAKGTTIPEGEIIEETNRLVSFIPEKDNIRIKGSANDQKVKKSTGLLVGVLAMMLFTYVIAVFVVHEIDQEITVIGTLYALGLRRKELMRYYMCLPVFITFMGGILGTAAGFSPLGVRIRMRECYHYFSVPETGTVIAPYLLFYGIVMPPLVAWVVNVLVIGKKLNRPALQLIQGEKQAGKSCFFNRYKEKETVKGSMKENSQGLIGIFRSRLLLREAGSILTVFLGMLLALMIFMIGLNTYMLCKNVEIHYKKDPRSEYMYTLRNTGEEMPEEGESCLAKKFKKKRFGYSFDVILLGIDEDNPFFTISFDGYSDHEVVISSAMAQKYGLKKGQIFTVRDEERENTVSFKVRAVEPYAVGYYMFARKEDMQEWFSGREDCFFVVMSDQPLLTDPNRLVAVTTKEEIRKAADVMLRLMRSLVVTVTMVSVMVFVLVMYLMLTVVIERSKTGISLLRILGFRNGELRKLYLNGHLAMTGLCTLVCVPLAKRLIDLIFPYMIANLGAPMDIGFSWQIYVLIFFSVMGISILIHGLLVEKIKRISPREILQHRE